MRIQKVAASPLTPNAKIPTAPLDRGQRVLGVRAGDWPAESDSLKSYLRRTKTLLFILLSIVAIGLCCGTNSSAGTIPISAFTGACAPLPPPSFPNFKTRLDAFVKGNCYGVKKQNWPHEASKRSSEGLHSPFVQLYYSPQLYRWMTPGNRQGQIPDGSMVIKEEYDDDTASAPICFWSVMTKDSNLWWDGWNWGVVGVEGPCGATPPPTPPPINGCADPQFPFNGPTAINCIGCHASAISGSSTGAGNPGTGTYSTPQFVTPATLGNVGATLPLFFPPIQTEGALLALSGNGSLFPPPPGACMVPVTKDLVASKPYTRNPRTTGPSLFVTSNQCAGCHDATDNTPLPTNMIFSNTLTPPYQPALPPVASDTINLSTYGEWRYSMMGLSGRDPIFFAQLDTESTVHSNIQGKSIFSAAFVQDTCLSCHGVMGQRQYHLDKGNGPLTYFTRNQLNDPNSKYAALARDGVSCMVCHQMIDKNLDDPSTYTGKFLLGSPGQVFGPYPSGNTDVPGPHEVVRVSMINGVGIAPVFGSQVGESKLCASCHTIVLPVYDNRGRQVSTDFEQTTYFEWLNSSFASTNYQSCQNCHMPDSFDSTKLAYRIANIEDSAFPEVPETPPFTSLPLDQLGLVGPDTGLEVRTEYARHQLNGINPFALEMFDQFRTILGLYGSDGLLPDPLRETYNGQKNAVNGTVALAQSSASVSVSATNTGGNLQADVTVTNLAGHKFPSGVSFRRAFLDFQVLDVNGNVLWESGGTNNKGVITNTAGQPLVTELFSKTQQNYQPHFWTGNPITSDQQVQIYEELVQDPQGQLTTSFLSLDNKIKDNRLLPQGWSSSGPHGDITQPEGTGADANYENGCGCSVVRYLIPLTAIPGATQVQATMYYQSIPPYYLAQRQANANGPDTKRLINFTNQLNVGTSYPEIANWKLKISSMSANIQ